jgi:hypothetical protein
MLLKTHVEIMSAFLLSTLTYCLVLLSASTLLKPRTFASCDDFMQPSSRLGSAHCLLPTPSFGCASAP